MNTRKWTTRDGIKIRIKDLDDEHLKNIIKMLERLHTNKIMVAYSTLGFIHGEMASYYLEQDLRAMESISSDHPLYDDLVQERDARTLKKRANKAPAKV
jgi:hypothetical protein